MKPVKFKIGKKFVRGDRTGKRAFEIIKLNKKDDIYKYLWDAVDSFERNMCNYIVEFYQLKKS